MHCCCCCLGSDDCWGPGAGWLLRRLERPEMLCKLSSPVTEATDSGLKLLLEPMVKCNQQSMKSVAFWIVVVLLVLLGSAELDV